MSAFDDCPTCRLDLWHVGHVCPVIPEPCPRCGWQYDDARLAAARRGDVKLDPNPTHLCQGGAA